MTKRGKLRGIELLGPDGELVKGPRAEMGPTNEEAASMFAEYLYQMYRPLKPHLQVVCVDVVAKWLLRRGIEFKLAAMRLLLDEPTWPVGLVAKSLYDRADDSGAGGNDLRVIADEQGDVWVTAYDAGSGEQIGLRFCTQQGGGRSPRVRAALLMLAEAIRLDNEEHPQS